ncbi:MAG: metallophosphoesterase family protein [Pseudomonadota bacterium]
MCIAAHTIHYVIGDIHGQLDQLSALLDAIEARHRWKHADQKGVLVYLGDYIDRGSDSHAVIDRVMTGVDGFESVFLKGNHEELMLNCLETEDRSAWNVWMAVGGEPTLKSFGYDLFYEKYNSARLAEVLGQRVLNWLGSLQLFYRQADFLCVHAGLLPGALLERQKEKDMLWIRRQFLDSDYDFGFGVIHGHTPSDRPTVKPNRIGIDTGAGQDGDLTALVVDRAWADLIRDPTFISV